MQRLRVWNIRQTHLSHNSRDKHVVKTVWLRGIAVPHWPWLPRQVDSQQIYHQGKKVSAFSAVPPVTYNRTRPLLDRLCLSLSLFYFSLSLSLFWFLTLLLLLLLSLFSLLYLYIFLLFVSLYVYLSISINYNEEKLCRFFSILFEQLMHYAMQINGTLRVSTTSTGV